MTSLRHAANGSTGQRSVPQKSWRIEYNSAKCQRKMTPSLYALTLFKQGLKKRIFYNRFP